MIQSKVSYTGVLPPHQSSHDFVLAQRKEQLKDLKQGLSLLNKGGDVASPEVTLLKLFLLERGQLPFQDIDMASRNFLLER